MKIFAIDVETGGFNPKTSALLEIAIIPIIHGEKQEPFVSYIRPFNGAEVSDGALKVNGLTRDQIKDFPSESEVFIKLLKFIDSHEAPLYLLGQNVQFDRDFLNEFFKRNMTHMEFVRRFRPELLCTLELSKKVFDKKRQKPANMKLGTLCEWFSIKLEKAHTALADIEATVELWDCLTAMEGFKEAPVELSYEDKRAKYIQPKYLQINADGGVYISSDATKDKRALEMVLAELHEIFSISKSSV